MPQTVKDQARTPPHGLMFHRFHAEGMPASGQGSISSTEFERIIDHIGVEKILAPDVWLDKLDRGALAPGDVCITFDDGLSSQRDVALPILERRGLKAFWFVFSSVFHGGIDRNEVYNFFAVRFFPDFDQFFAYFFDRCHLPFDVFSSPRFLRYEKDMRQHFAFYSASDIQYRFVRNACLDSSGLDAVMERCMVDRGTSVSRIAADLWLKDADLILLRDLGHDIGLHSYSHPYVLADLPESEQRAEYVRNFGHIMSMTGRRPRAVSHPLGSYDRATLAILSELGVVCGFRSSMTPGFDPDHRAFANLQIPRADAADIRRDHLGRCPL